MNNAHPHLESALPKRGWEAKLRRGFDTSAALIGLLVLSPLLLIAATAILVTSPGPILFRQERVGRNGVRFKILKFRTMRTDAEKYGGQLTVGDDARITPIGRHLRALKIDELPQLVNVLRGDMALVGPRPEVPRYVELYTVAQKRVLSVRPGITDPASLTFRAESDLMATQAEPERYYIDTLMPEKLRLNLEYLNRRTLWTDIDVILQTLIAIVRHGSGK